LPVLGRAACCCSCCKQTDEKRALPLSLHQFTSDFSLFPTLSKGLDAIHQYVALGETMPEKNIHFPLCFNGRGFNFPSHEIYFPFYFSKSKENNFPIIFIFRSISFSSCLLTISKLF